EELMRFISHMHGLQPFYGSKGLKKRILSAYRKLVNEGGELTKEKVIVLALSSISKVVGQDPNAEKTIALGRSKNFFKSQHWRHIRLQALSKNDGSCEACGKRVADGAQLHVDHILPRSIYPEFALTLNNLQILCKECNFGKGNVNTTNFKRRNEKAK